MKNVPLILFLLLVVACTERQGQNGRQAANAPEMPMHNRPFDKVDVPYSTYQLDAKKGGDIALINGSKLKVPTAAFVDKNGNVPKGKVSIKYREVHSPLAILMSGLPMSYDSSGVSGNFISAGMFELLAFDGSEPLEVAKGKQLDLKMASYQTSSDYNLYYLENGKWKYEDRSPAPEVVNAQTSKDNIPVVPEKATPTQKSEQLFTFDFPDPELKKYSKQKWCYVGNDPANSPASRSEIFSVEWEKASIKKVSGHKYRLKLRRGKQSYQALLEPTLSPAEVDSINAKEEREFAAELASLRKKELMDRSEARVFRNIAISRMGAYNFDKLYKVAQVNMVAAHLELPKGEKKDDYRFYYMNSFLNTAIEMKSGEAIPLMDKQMPYIAILGISAEGNMVYFGPEDFTQINYRTAIQLNSQQFTLKKVPQNLSENPKTFLAQIPGSLGRELQWL